MFVSCLCLTKDRPNWLAKAITSFKTQTYTDRELVVVADKIEDVPLGCYSQMSGRLLLVCHPGLVGAKRNYGCSIATGSLIAIWDDDDWSEPTRLEYQVNRLQRTNTVMTGFNAMKFTDGKDWWQYSGNQHDIVATSQMFRKEFWDGHRFLDMNCGQDEIFSTRARGAGLLDADYDRDLMYATIHPGNTSPRATAQRNNWKPLPGYQWKAA